MLLYYWTCFKLRVTRVLILLEIFHPGTILHFKLNQLYNHFGNLLDNRCKISDFRRSLINSTWFVEMKICRSVLFRVPFHVNNLHSFAIAKDHLWIVGTLCIVGISWICGTTRIVGTLSTVGIFWIHCTSWIVGTHFLSLA